MFNGMELLESRQLLAGEMMIDPNAGLITVSVEGTAGNDHVSVNRDALGNLLVNHNGVVTTYAGASVGKIVVNGNLGDDYVYASNAVGHGVEIRGGNGNDTLFGGGGGDVVEGGRGKDFVYGQNGNDVLDGGVTGITVNEYTNTGDDQVQGGEGNDTLRVSGRGTCTLIGGNGDDVIYGGAGNDMLYGAAGHDVMSGGDGNDHLYGYTGNDTMNGEGGDDLVRGEAGNDVVRGGADHDAVHGDDGDDQIYGDWGNDRLFGGQGADLMDGGYGWDKLVAVGGGQNDTLYGGPGGGDSDTFWADKEASEIIADADATETSGGWVHRVGGFMSYRWTNGSVLPAGWTYTNISRELEGQNFPDPLGGSDYRSFSDRRLYPSTGFSADDVRAGELRDSTFLASVASVAKQNWGRIWQAVVDLGDETYAVRFFDGSTERYVRVDGDLPTNGGTLPAYARLGAEGSVWVAIIEKAYAYFRKNDSNYESIARTGAAEALRALGAKNVDSANVDSGYTPESLWSLIANRLANGKAVVAQADGNYWGVMVERAYVDAAGKMVFELQGSSVAMSAEEFYNRYSVLVTANV